MANEIEELFSRIRSVETRITTLEADTKYSGKSLDDFKNIFEKHDIEEMKKYDEINKNFSELSKTMNRFLGGFIVVQVFVLPILIGIVVNLIAG